MRMNIYCCLLALVLGSNTSARAGIIRKTIKEKDPVTLPCPHSVEGKVMWSRERNGRRVDILLIDGDRDIRLLHKPYKGYSSLADKSLHIVRAGVSDSGRYFCNNEVAAELTVIPSGAGIIRKTIKEKDPVTLPCPHSVEGKVMWSRERNGRRVDILLIDGDRDIRLLHKPYKGYSSLADKSLHIVRAGVSDSGRYFCNNEVAAELTVIPSGAGIIRKTIKEKDPVTLPCPHSVEGKVMWSRERNGRRVDILLIDGDRDIRLLHKPYKGYSSLADKSLHIVRAGVSDSGRYFCNNEVAAELTVIPSGAGIIRKTIKEKDPVTLPCPHSVEGKVMWSRERNGRRVDILLIDGDRDIRLLHKPYKGYSSLADKSLHIVRAGVSDSGRYFCNNEVAAELTVIPSGAGIIRKTIKEKDPVTLPCPHSVEGKVMWSRERNGRRVDILLIDGDRDIRLLHKPYKGYSSLADKSLHIVRAGVSDSGRYFCNNEVAAELTVIPSGAGIIRKTIKEKDPVTLPCPHSVEGKVMWSRERNGRRVDILLIDGDRDIRLLHKPYKGYSSLADKSLHIVRAGVSDSGRYFCNNEVAAELTVIPSGAGIIRKTIKEKDPVTLPCPHSVEGKVMWSRERNGRRVDILLIDGDRDIRLLHKPYKGYSSLADKSLHIVRAGVSDSGRYFCNNEVAAELTVIPSGAGIIRKTIKEKDPVTLPCPHSVEGKVMWSRERNGRRVDILLIDGDRDIRLLHKPYKGYSSLADKSLHIVRAGVSDSGRYFCNNEVAAELTVIPSGAGIIRKTIKEKDPVTLPCPHSVEGKVMWSRERNGRRVDILLIDGDRDIRLLHKPYKGYSSLADKSLHIVRAGVSDSGRYFCNNEVAAELTVIPSGAGIIRKTIKEKDPVTLPCPHSVEGKVMWSRERNGRRVDILLIDGDRDIRLLHKPYKGYSSLADKSLHIVRAGVSDSGRYFCNNEVAAELTVIPSGAGIIRKTIKEKDPVTLPCPHSVEGKVMWSRERNGRRVDILLIDGDRDIRLLHKPYKGYSSLADKSLHIVRAGVSDSGRYFCNNEVAAELTVIPSGAGIIRKTIKEKDPVTLPCPHSVEGKVMWSRERNGRRVDILLIDGDRDIRLLHKPYKGYSSLADKSLHIVRAGVSDSGRYFCNNEVAAELTVIPG
ncbi:hemicentin-1-like [Micropterus salmoides]|uniref:hemicentin-1-like n=1 Tax=Micropterus salmoides TaxID=27706 RepID=UPI0018EA4A69|nr:hemicentin-1-like [Micropterus salmoides]